jgi:hypothetical protein
LLAAGVLEGVEHLLRGGSRVDVKGYPACPHQVGSVPHLGGGSGDPHSGDEGRHAAEDKDAGLRRGPAIGLSEGLGQDSKPIEGATGGNGDASNPVVSWKGVGEHAAGDPGWADSLHGRAEVKLVGVGVRDGAGRERDGHISGRFPVQLGLGHDPGVKVVPFHQGVPEVLVPKGDDVGVVVRVRGDQLG